MSQQQKLSGQGANFKDNYGASLIELIGGMTIAAILAAAAAPNLGSLISSNRVTTHTNTLLEALSLARSSAVGRQQIVNVCHRISRNSNTCSLDFDYGSKWSHGWLVFIDYNSNRIFDVNDDLIRVFELPDATNVVFNQQGALRFHPDGSARSAGFYICEPTQKHFRHVYLLHTGRTRVNKTLSESQKKLCNEI